MSSPHFTVYRWLFMLENDCIFCVVYFYDSIICWMVLPHKCITVQSLHDCTCTLPCESVSIMSPDSQHWFCSVLLSPSVTCCSLVQSRNMQVQTQSWCPSLFAMRYAQYHFFCTFRLPYLPPTCARAIVLFIVSTRIPKSDIHCTHPIKAYPSLTVLLFSWNLTFLIFAP